MSVGTIASQGRRSLRAVAIPRVSQFAAAVVGLTVLAAALRFFRIGHQGFWVDEGTTAHLLHFSLGRMLGLIPQTESSPPLYYCIAWVWARVFGFTEAPLRSLSALAGIATVPVAWAAARTLFSERAGLIAAALTACNPLLIWYSQEARAYAMLVLLTSVALLAFARAREHPTPRALGIWAVACGLALATHYFAALAVAPQAALLLVAHRRRRSVQLGVAVVVACGLALVPLAISQDTASHLVWIHQMAFGSRLGQIIPQFLVGFQASAYAVLAWISGACALGGLALAWRVRGAGTVAMLALAGFALMLALVAVGVDDLITRNLLALWLPAAVVVSAGLAARRAGFAAAFVMCAIGVFAAGSVAVDRGFERPDWRLVARVLGTRPAPGVGARAILIQEYGDALPLALYLPGAKFWAVGAKAHSPGLGLAQRSATLRVTELDVIAKSGHHSPICWYGGTCELWPSRMQATYAIPGLHELWRRRVLQFSVIRLVSSRPVTLTDAVVSRALRSTSLDYDEVLFQSG